MAEIFQALFANFSPAQVTAVLMVILLLQNRSILRRVKRIEDYVFPPPPPLVHVTDAPRAKAAGATQP